jgi:hypothetical protein
VMLANRSKVNIWPNGSASPGDYWWFFECPNSDTRWSWMVGTTFQIIYLQDKNQLYPLDRRFSGLQNLSQYCGEEKGFLPLPGIKLWLSKPQPVTMQPELSRVCFPRSHNSCVLTCSSAMQIRLF